MDLDPAELAYAEQSTIILSPPDEDDEHEGGRKDGDAHWRSATRRSQPKMADDFELPTFVQGMLEPWEVHSVNIVCVICTLLIASITRIIRSVPYTDGDFAYIFLRLFCSQIVDGQSQRRDAEAKRDAL
jgi:hypothetical protein